MRFPFTHEEFFSVFAAYNTAVWPAHVVLFVIALASAAAVRGIARVDRLVSVALAVLWAWMAIAYHFLFFSAVNPAAWVFGAAFLVAAAAFAIAAAKSTLRFDATSARSSKAGLLMILYALFGYPVVGMLAGQSYPRTPTFGLPCPTTIFTLGMLLLARRPVPATLFVVPLAWSVIATSAAVALGVPQDFGLTAAALVTAGILVMRRLPQPLRQSRNT